MCRVYYKEKPKWLEITKDFILFKEAFNFLDSKKWRGYIVLLGNFKLWKI